MKQFLLTLLLFFSLLPLSAQKAECYAEWITSHEQVYAGDSCLASIVLYSTLPFLEVKGDIPTLRTKGGRARLVAENRTQQDRIRTKRGLFYRLVLQQYVVGSEEVGKLQLPKQRYKVTLGIYRANNHPFDFFFGSEPQLVKTITTNISLPLHQLAVVSIPKRNTQDMIRSGQHVF